MGAEAGSRELEDGEGAQFGVAIGYRKAKGAQRAPFGFRFTVDRDN